jgi:hypothetical protein
MRIKVIKQGALMNLSTQIGGSHQQIIKSLRDMLTHQDITVAHPSQDELIFSSGDDPWTRYETELSFFESIAMSSFHIVANTNGVIDYDISLQIIYAMLKEKPTILLNKPTFDKSVDAFTREVITARFDLGLLQVKDLSAMEAAEINYLLKNADTHLDYKLTSHEAALIQSHVKAHFRMLLEDAKQALLLQPATA